MSDDDRRMELIAADAPLASRATQVVQEGDLHGLRLLIETHPELATVRIGDDRMSRTLLHAATDYPGHYPNNAATVALLLEAGAEVDARFAGPHTETPLHWAASSDDVEVLDLLLDAGADIEAGGGVVGNGTPLADAVAFAQWRAADRLIECGATANLWQAAALGMLDQVAEFFTGEDPPPSENEVTDAFWCACHGGRRVTAEYLLAHGAELNRAGFDNLTPLDAAERSQATELADWLRGLGARPASQTA